MMTIDVTDEFKNTIHNNLRRLNTIYNNQVEEIAIKDKEIAELKAQIEILNKTKHTEREILDKFIIPKANEEWEVKQRKENDEDPDILEWERKYCGEKHREESPGLWSTEKWTEFKGWFLHTLIVDAMEDRYMPDYYESFRACEGKVDEVKGFR
jgi:hypothetical protein